MGYRCILKCCHVSVNQNGAYSGAKEAIVIIQKLLFAVLVLVFGCARMAAAEVGDVKLATAHGIG